MGLEEVDLAANIIASEANPDANIIWGVAFDKNMDDEMRITVIATGFEKDPSLNSSIPVGEIVEKAWDKKINSIPNPADNSSSADNLDIPSFLRNKRGMNK